jgi:hypothetical protein
MHFAARELKPYAEPLMAAEIEEDSVYFDVAFLDDAMLIPALEPYVFVGKDLDPEETGLYFQDIDSYRRGTRFKTANESNPASFVLESETRLHLFEFESALEQLMKCALRWRRLGQESLSSAESMRFEERDLKPFQEPLPATALEKGLVYFSVIFADADRLIPILEPYVFVGGELEPGTSGQLYFQDFESYQRGVRFATATEVDHAKFFLESESKLRFFDFELALEELLTCSLRRRVMNKR